MSSRTLKVRYVGDATGLEKTQAGIANSLSNVGKAATKAGHSISSFGRSWSEFVTLPVVGILALSERQFLKTAQAAAQTNKVLTSTGHGAHITAAGVAALSKRLGDLTQQNDAEVQSSLNVLLGFTKVRNEVGKGNAIFDRAALTIQNVAARLNKGMLPTTIAVGKALQDPVHGLTSLVRLGIQFTDQQKAQIASMVASGHQMEAQKLILDALSQRYDGAAAAAGLHASASQKLQHSLEDLGNSIGSIVNPILQQLAVYAQGVVNWFDHLDAGTRRSIVKWAALAAALGPVLFIGGKILSLFGNLVSIAGAIVGGLSRIAGGFVGVAGAEAAAEGGAAALFGPAGWIVLGVGALVGLGLALKHNKTSIKDWLNEVDAAGVLTSTWIDLIITLRNQINGLIGDVGRFLRAIPHAPAGTPASVHGRNLGGNFAGPGGRFASGFGGPNVVLHVHGSIVGAGGVDQVGELVRGALLQTGRRNGFKVGLA